MKRFFPLLLLAAPAFAEAPQVVGVTVTQSSGAWRFDVSVLHAETGWDHYADGWRVEAADGTILGERPLAHPHENEQPFTRSQGGIVIPDGTVTVYIRARDNVDGWFDQLYPVDLP